MRFSPQGIGIQRQRTHQLSLRLPFTGQRLQFSVKRRDPFFKFLLDPAGWIDFVQAGPAQRVIPGHTDGAVTVILRT